MELPKTQTEPKLSGVGGHSLDWRPIDKSNDFHPCFVDFRNGLVSTDGNVGRVKRNLAEILTALPTNVDRVYLLGVLPGGTPRRFAEWINGDVPEGWRHGNHLLVGERPIGHYFRPSGKRVSVRTAGTWMDLGCSVTEADTAWRHATNALQRRWKDARLLGTPGETGKALIRSSWSYDSGRFRGSPGWDDLPKEAQAVIRDNTTQARSEYLCQPEIHPQRVIEVDRRFAYAGYTKEIASAPAVWSDEPARASDFDRGGRLAFAPGLYHIRFRVPQDWNHIGLFPVRDGKTWTWPSEPGFAGESWVDIAEIGAALFNERGRWDFEVVESLRYEHRAGTGRNGPLYQWGKWLIEAEESLRRRKQDRAALLLRNVVRHTIGWLGPKPRTIEHSVPMEEAFNAPSTMDVHIVGDDLVWKEDAELFSPEWSHPEWNRQVWARCRAGMTRFALKLPREHIVNIETDAIFVSELPELLPDTGRAGQLRCKTVRENIGKFHDRQSFRKAFDGG
jgi:hypothetical protein